MSRIFKRRPKKFIKTALMAVPVLIFVIGVSLNVQAASVTYNLQSDTGTTVATGITTNAPTSCANGTAPITSLMSAASHNCTSQRSTLGSGTGNIVEAYYNTAYSSDMNVTGTSIKVRLRDGSSGGWTAGIMLFYVNSAGTKTNFTGSEVTQSIFSGGDQTYSLSLALQSATVPAGSKLGIRVRATAGSSSLKRVYWGSTADTAGTGTSGVLIVNETLACSDSDLATLTITAPAGSSTVSGTYTVQVDVGTETMPSGMTGMVVNIANAGACNVTNGVMTWNGTSSLWEYSWNTSACGTITPVTGVTVNSSGTDPDCSTNVNAAQVTNVTINNTDPDPATLTITAPAGSSTVSGTYTVQVQVGTETQPQNMNNMRVNIAGSDTCNVTNGVMTWNAGTSRWEYLWNTSACGTVTVDTGVTVDASGNDPDNGALKNASQITNVTIDNRDPSTLKDCGSCHAYPPLDGTRDGATGAVVGDHQVHTYICSTCHVIPATETSADFAHRNANIQMKAGATAIDSGYYDKNGNSAYNAGVDDTFAQTNSPVTATCRTVACHGGLQTPQWGVGTTTCSDCHGGVVKSVRRTITGASSDFSKEGTGSTHVASGINTPAKATCQACHGTHLGLGVDPNAALLNADTGAAITYDGTAASTEVFCVSCHDSNGAARLGTPTDPFDTDGANVVDIGWTIGTVAHSQAANANKCLACHGNSGGTGTTLNPTLNAHASDETKIIRYSYTITDSVTTAANICYQCHGNVAANGAVDEIKDQFDLTGGRHSTITCRDCHSEHKAEPGNHTKASSTLAGVLKGVTGYTPTWNAGSWTGASVLTVGTADAEYKICYKCHAATGTTVVMSGTGPTSLTNTALEFSPNNEAYHPVVQALPSTGNRRLAIGALTGGWSPGGVMTCSDCHSTDVSGKYGPHGSSVKWMLNPNTTGTKYYNWPYTSSANNGLSTGTLLTGTGSMTVPTNNFCSSCHVWSGGGDAHTNKGSDHSVACVSCHIRVPHGGKILRLLSGPNAPARYKPDGNGGGTVNINGATRPASGTIQENQCNTNTAGTCGHKHQSGTAQTW